MTLPEIPDEAVLAVLNNAGISTDFDRYPAARTEHQWALEDLSVAWPHLYAAALNDVADRIDGTHSLDGGRGWDTNTDTIRAYADEAIKGKP